MAPEHGPTPPQDRLLKREQLVARENAKWELCVTIPSIRISGQAGAGKTTIANELAKMLGLPVIKVGQIDRGRVPTDTDYRKRSDSYDRALDAEIVQVLQEATLESPEIVEANLAGVLGNFVDANRTEKGISILVVAREQERVRRIHRRQNEKRAQEKKLPLSQREVRIQTRQRHEGNLKKWRKLYDTRQYKLIGENDPHKPGAKDPRGHLFATIVIDTTNATTVADSLRIMRRKLMEEGIIRRKRVTGQVFPTPAVAA